MKSYSLGRLADHELLKDLAASVTQDRCTTALMLAQIAEVDARRLYAAEGYASMFLYCVVHLGLSEDAAAKRIQAARAARQFPAILAALADGRLHLSAVVLLAPHLTPATADDLLAGAARKSKAEIALLLAQRFPQPDVPTLITPIAAHPTSDQHAPGHVGMTTTGHAETPVAATTPIQTAPTPIAAPPPPPSRITPLAPQTYALQTTLRSETYEKLQRLCALLGHAVPSGDMDAVLARAFDLAIAAIERQKFGVGSRTRAGSRRCSGDPRQIPAAVRSEVFRRDEGRCTFVSESGKRCESSTRLELDHVTPIARGGPSTAANLRLRCRTHNQHEAERTFGAGFMERKRQHARRRSAPLADALRARHAAQEREVAAAAAEGVQNADVIPWLRRLGVSAEAARRGAAQCDARPDAPIEARVRRSLDALGAGGGAAVGTRAEQPGI